MNSTQQSACASNGRSRVPLGSSQPPVLPRSGPCVARQACTTSATSWWTPPSCTTTRSAAGWGAAWAGAPSRQNSRQRASKTSLAPRRRSSLSGSDDRVCRLARQLLLTPGWRHQGLLTRLFDPGRIDPRSTVKHVWDWVVILFVIATTVFTPLDLSFFDGDCSDASLAQARCCASPLRMPMPVRQQAHGLACRICRHRLKPPPAWVPCGRPPKGRVSTSA